MESKGGRMEKKEEERRNKMIEKNLIMEKKAMETEIRMLLLGRHIDSKSFVTPRRDRRLWKEHHCKADENIASEWVY
jgi:hypothetical protein